MRVYVRSAMVLESFERYKINSGTNPILSQTDIEVNELPTLLLDSLIYIDKKYWKLNLFEGGVIKF